MVDRCLAIGNIGVVDRCLAIGSIGVESIGVGVLVAALLAIGSKG